MKLDPNNMKPIYIQISEGIEDDILNEILKPNEQAYSQYQIAKQFNINPATAAKGINLLVQEEILYKKRGLGMHVTENAKELIIEKRKNNFVPMYIKEMVIEAKKLGITKIELKEMIDKCE